MFGEVSTDSEDAEGREEGYQSDDSVKNVRTGGGCDEDSDEFMIVMMAIRERRKIEAESGRPLLKDKLS